MIETYLHQGRDFLGRLLVKEKDNITDSNQHGATNGRGFLPIYKNRRISRESNYQNRKLVACGVDPQLYGDTLETSLFGQDCFKMMTCSGLLLDGLIHVNQSFKLHRLASFGEQVWQSGCVKKREPHPYGVRCIHKFTFVNENLAPLVESEMIFLEPDPNKLRVKSASDLRFNDPKNGFFFLASKTLQPKDIIGFSEDVGNLIHFDSNFAKEYGYRTPISQGIQTMTWMMSALAKKSVPKTLDVTAKFIRPVYWDDIISLWSDKSDDNIPTILRVLDSKERLLVELRLSVITY